MKAIAAQPEAISCHVYMKAIMHETGAVTHAEALTTVRAMSAAMLAIMDATGAPDTAAAMATVKDMVLVLKEGALRRMEAPTEVIVYAS